MGLVHWELLADAGRRWLERLLGSPMEAEHMKIGLSDFLSVGVLVCLLWMYGGCADSATPNNSHDSL